MSLARVQAQLAMIPADTPGGKILHVGCTDHFAEHITAHNPAWLHGALVNRFGFGVHGMDIRADLLSLMASQDFAHLTHGDVMQADQWPEGKFWVIVAGELIEHLDNPGLFLDNCRAHLEDDGVLILSTPYQWSLDYWVYAMTHFPRTTQNTEHTQAYDLSTLAETARRHRFSFTWNRHDWCIIKEYSTDTASRVYNAYGRVMRLLSPVLPARVGKTMITRLYPVVE